MHSSDESDLSEDKKSGLSDDKEPAKDVPLTGKLCSISAFFNCIHVC